MELDVHIVREVNSAWGFTLVGGNDSEIPLTVIKVLPDSPADRAGLQNGDTVLRIEDQSATEMSHAVASNAVNAAEDSLVLGVVRGLYDPVLDDYEPIYEPVDQEDTDQPSDPTEVFKLAAFIEVPPPQDPRSLTASPFLTPTKPYRPFSTDPVEVPPLEDPIILNPNYKDVFPQREVEDILEIKPDIPPESRFKLPISAQYDPEGKKIKKLTKEEEQRKTIEIKEETKEQRESQAIRKETAKHEMKQKEAEYLEKMKKEIDLEKIEMTASEVVEESIQKAVSVAEEIKNEIEIEIGSSKREQVDIKEVKSEFKETKVEKEVKMEMKEEHESSKVEVKDAKVVSELVELIDKTTEEIIKQSETKDVKKEIEKIESAQDAPEESRLSTKQELEEVIEAGSVRRKSMVYEEIVEERKGKEEMKVEERKGVEESIKKDKQDYKEVRHEKEMISDKASKTSDSKFSTARLLAEQRAYTIGLQTIPKIRGSTHSSYHYNLLLKTFFIHLTDVMVALSRFILTEPVLSEEKETQDMVTVTESVKEKEMIKKEQEMMMREQERIKREQEMVIREQEKVRLEQEKLMKEQEMVRREQEMIREEKEKIVSEAKERDVKIKESKIEKEKKDILMEQQRVMVDQRTEELRREEERLAAEAKALMYRQERERYMQERETFNEDLDEEFYEEEEFIETRRKTGAEMAQMVERKSPELIEKLDAVITEFQKKSGIEEPDRRSVSVQRRTRSRSRSKAQERRDELEMSRIGRESELEMSRVSRQDQMGIKSMTSASYDAQMRGVVATEPIETRVGRHEISETQTMSKQSYESKMHRERRELKTPVPYVAPTPEVPTVPQTQDGKITYVAIVESHVYTNKDAIFEEIARKETTEKIEASKMEKIAVESSVKKEKEETVIQKAQEVEQKVVEEIQPIQIIEDVKSVHIEQASTVIETAATSIAESSEVVIEEVKDEVLKIKEPPAKSLEVVYEASAKSVAEASEAYVEEVKTESLEVVAPKALQAKETVETAIKTVAEASEVRIEEVKHEEFKVEEPVVTKAAEVIVEDKATEVAEASSVSVKRGKTMGEASAELKIVKLVPVDVEEPVIVISEVELALQKRDVADSKVYESIVGVQTGIEEKHELLDVSQIATFKSVGETKLDKTIKADEVEEIPVQVIEKTEVAIEGLDEEETKLYQAVLVAPGLEQEFEGRAITLETTIEASETQIESKKESYEAKASFEAKAVSEASFEAKSVQEVSFEAKSVQEASFEATSVQEVSFEATSVQEASFEAKSVKKVSFEAETVAEASFEAKSVSEASFEAQSVQKSIEQKLIAESQKELSLQEKKEVSAKEEVEEPVVTEVQSPPVPATPVTDEYMFKLEIPLPKTRGTTPVPRDCTPPDDEDPNIVKKKLIPHIDTAIESYTYEPPLPTPPPGRELGSPEYKKPGLQGGSPRWMNMRYIKPGLRGGSDREEMTKEEIMEIDRKSSLLASEIDKTIKSIEEYKKEVGIEAKKEISMSSKTVRIEHKTISSNGHTIEEKTKEVKDNFEKEWKEIEKQVQNNHKDVNELSVNVTIEEANGDKNGKEDDRVQIIEVEVSARNGHTNGYSKTENGSKTESHEEVTKTEKIADKTNGVVKVTFDLKEEKSAKSDNKSETIEEVIESVEKVQTSVDTEKVKDVKTEIVSESIENVQKSAAENGYTETITHNTEATEEPKVDPMQLYRPVKFDPEEIARRKKMASVPIIQEPMPNDGKPKVYMTDTGEIIGSYQGIVDGLEEAVVDIEVAKALGKPGMPDEKIAELISGEAEMLREAHVMGLSRVLSSHMHRADDDSSVDFQKIKPVIESLKDSEVLKALNEEVLRVKEEKKKEEKKWTTFLQKPKRPPPRPKYGYYRFVEEEKVVEEPYKVKIVKQPKPKVAPDYKPEDFDTGPLPWEQPQPELVPGAPPIEPEEPILIPEESPEFLEAVDPLPESEVPDLEDTGIPLPPPRPPQQYQVVEPPEETEHIEESSQEVVEEEVEEPEQEEEMDGEQLAEQLLKNVQKMVDPNATLEQQLAQMRAQVAALAQLPCVIQQTLDLVARQISQLSHKESMKVQATEEQQYQVTEETYESVTEKQETEEAEEQYEEQEQYQEKQEQRQQPTVEITEPEEDQVRTEEKEESKPMLSEEELARRKQQEEAMMAEQQKIEKQRKEVMEQMQLEHESRQVKQRPTPRVGKPKPMFGPPTPVNRPLVLPGGRKWRKPKDVYDEQMIAEMINAHSEVIQGKVMGINFMKYEKPPVSLDHLQRSEVYKVVHNLDETPLKRVETLTPVIAESDYRERCRSLSPFPSEQRVKIPEQLQP